MFSCVTSCKQIGSHFKYCKVIAHVQTELEPNGLNKDLCSFSSCFIQLYA